MFLGFIGSTDIAIGAPQYRSEPVDPANKGEAHF